MQSIEAVIKRDVIEVQGPDAALFLQGQLSQDILSLSVGVANWSFLLHPAGKVVTLLRVYRENDDGFILLTDEGSGPAAVDRLKRFMLRTTVSVEGSSRNVLVVRGVSRPPQDDGAQRVVIEAGWPLIAGFDVVDPEGTQREPTSGEQKSYELCRLLNGVPTVGRELTDKTIPDETGWVQRAVSFTKGCYTGQELVARIDSRGHVNRHLRLISGEGGAPQAGASLSVSGDSIGSVTSAAEQGDAFVGMAYTKRQFEVPGIANLSDGRPVQIKPLPESV